MGPLHNLKYQNQLMSAADDRYTDANMVTVPYYVVNGL